MRVRYVIALLLLIPLADALFLVVVADRLGWELTVALVVLTAILGMLLVRAESRHTLTRIQRKLAGATPPTDELLDGAFLVAAGAFLLTPGLVTDAVGFLLAFPPTRVPARRVLKRFVVVPYLDRRTGGFASGNVWVGGFPDGDGFDAEGGFGTVGSDGPDDPDGFGGRAGTRGPDETGQDGGTTADGTVVAAGDDVVDVDYTVEESDAG